MKSEKVANKELKDSLDENKQTINRYKQLLNKILSE